MNYTAKIGDVIKMRSWHGVVLDIFKSKEGKTILRVQTVRNIFRKLGPELIEVDIAPDQLSPATLEDLHQEIALHKKMQNEALEQFLSNVKPTVAIEKDSLKV